MKIVNKIENPFSDTLVLKHERKKNDSYRSHVYLEISSKKNSDDAYLRKPVYVHFKKEKLLLLY